MPKDISRLKKLLISNKMMKILSTFGSGFVETSGYDRENGEQCYRILYRLKRSYYKIIWNRCFCNADRLQKDIIKSSKYCVYNNLYSLLYKYTKLDYRLVISMHRNTIKTLFDRIQNENVINCCITCMSDIKPRPFSIIVNKRESTCIYCYRTSMINTIRIDRNIGLTLFGKQY